MRDVGVKYKKSNSNKNQKENGNATLYFFQGIACILVVLIHIPFPGIIGTFFVSLARIAVPLFYMISGYTLYFYIGSDKYKSKLGNRIRKNAIVTGLALFAYLLIDIAKCILQRESILEYLTSIVEIDDIILFLTVGIIPVSSGRVLWFIYGLLYVYIIMYIVPPKKKYIYRNAIISFVVMVLFSAAKVFFTVYPADFIGIDLKTYWIYGNWAVIGLSSVTIGIAIAKFVDEYPEKIKTIRRWSPTIGILCILINFVVCFVLDRRYGMYLSYTIFTLVLDILIFIISTKEFIAHSNFIVILGEKHSRNVYLWHPIFVSITNYAVLFLQLSKVKLIAWFQPLTVICVTIIFSVILNKALGFAVEFRRSKVNKYD